MVSVFQLRQPAEQMASPVCGACGGCGLLVCIRAGQGGRGRAGQRGAGRPNHGNYRCMAYMLPCLFHQKVSVFQTWQHTSGMASYRLATCPKHQSMHSLVSSEPQQGAQFCSSCMLAAVHVRL